MKKSLTKPKIEVLKGEFHITVFRQSLEKSFQGRQELRQESVTLADRVAVILADGPKSRADISRALVQKKISGQVNRVLAELLRSGTIGWTIQERSRTADPGNSSCWKRDKRERPWRKEERFGKNGLRNGYSAPYANPRVKHISYMVMK